MDRDLLEEGTRDLASYFQSQGYFDAAVTYDTASGPDGQQYIDYIVDRGPRHKIVKLEIVGNHYFDDDTLRERISVMPATLIRYRYGRYSRNALERDVEGIRDLYRANGFREAEVSSQEIDNYMGQDGADRHPHQYPGRPAVVRLQTRHRRRDHRQTGPHWCPSCTPPKASPTAN